MTLTVTAQRLRSLLSYDPETGEFRWREARNGVRDDKRAGWVENYNGTRYLRIEIGGRKYLAHRLAWLYVTGEWPKGRLDHKDTNGLNNRFENLRPANPSQNAANRGANANNASGYKGVSYHKPSEKWVAYICKSYKNKNLGYFDTPEQAHVAYCKAAKEKFGEYARVS